jgi:D-xylose transport system ATP-binding protein
MTATAHDRGLLSQDPKIPLVSMMNIGKSFPGTRALKGISFDLGQGEIHALVGENGAGKSTLMKILAGVYPYGEYEGEILIAGRPQRFRNISDAEAAGIGFVHQELSLVPELSVAENIFLGRAPQRLGTIRWDEMYQRTGRLLDQVGLELDPRTPVLQLGIGQQQLVEIAKALSHEVRILILDEPTSALTETEAETLFRILRTLSAHSTGIIYISHRLNEVFRLCDRITVLRDGSSVLTESASRLDEPRLIQSMVGREMSQLFPPVQRSPGNVVFEVRGVGLENDSLPGQPLLQDISFSVRSGEVLGIAGLMGAGRSELLMALFGGYGEKPTGRVFIQGKEVKLKDPCDAIAHGIAFVTEDRRRYGLLLDQNILHNLTIAALRQISGRVLTNEPGEIGLADKLVRDLQIKTPSLFTSAGVLSGGNQQKVVLGKWLLTKPLVLFLDEPTRGIDVGAKEELYRRINDLANQGLAVVLVSSELEEVMGLADRILVLHRGKITKEFSHANATSEKIMACAVGHPELS